ncbi:FBD-associated F-box protein At4g10400-like [Euphorbia lathyris]|uniref:FBD-associated F-box protein At4g10400-like n=1 Tax=Euphorbia lathyris TaxID=212925 RepID=UPI003313B18F
MRTCNLEGNRKKFIYFFIILKKFNWFANVCVRRLNGCNFAIPVIRNERHCDHICVDGISKLPDEILVQILSHLRTKEAVATSILSKRWEYLWTSTSNLDFSDHFLTSYQNEIDLKQKSLIFKRYVDTAIFYHGTSILQRCQMTFHTKYFSDNIYTWICALITCNIKELRLFDYSLTAQQLPWRLFTCKSLVVLKIYGSFVLDLPTYVCFPSLRVLNLVYVMLVDDASMHKLLSSCPVLEKLLIVIGKNDFVRVLNISIPSLRKLIIHSEVQDSRIEINTPCLEYLRHRVVFGNSSSVNLLSSLIRAELFGNVNINLLNAISQVRSLVLEKCFMQQLSINDTLPTFNNLKKMKLHGNFDWKLLLKILKLTPNLQVLVFPSGLVELRTDGLDFDRFNWHWHWHWPEFVPECLSMNVKTVEVRNFVGFEEELYFMKYLLECGKVMDKLIIRRFDFSTTPSIKKTVEDDKIMLEMLNYERGSTTCEVVFTA